MIVFKGIDKNYGDLCVLKDINLTIKKGEIVALIGESGAGKTTLLKMINKLIPMTKGEIWVNGRNVSEWEGISLRRSIGYVIQQHGLFPHMSVRQNIQILPEVENRINEDIVQRTNELLELVGLNPCEYLERYPSQLSGGQRQRIGVVRALLNNPEIILMDEPFSAVDPITRTDLQDELLHIQRKLKKTIVFVTHDMDEAIKLADKICVLQKGRIIQYDTPEQIIKHPKGAYVKELIGEGKIWRNPQYIRAKDAGISNMKVAIKTENIQEVKAVMRKYNLRQIIVVNQKGKLEGVVRLAYIEHIENQELYIYQFVDKKVPTIQETGTLIEIMDKFVNNSKDYLVVVDENHYVRGLITKKSLIKLLGTQFLTKEAN